MGNAPVVPVYAAPAVYTTPAVYAASPTLLTSHATMPLKIGETVDGGVNPLWSARYVYNGVEYTTFDAYHSGVKTHRGYGSRTGGHTGGECACCGGGEDCACCEASEKGLLLNVTERSTKEPLTGSCVNPTFDAWFFSDTTGTFFFAAVVWGLASPH